MFLGVHEGMDLMNELSCPNKHVVELELEDATVATVVISPDRGTSTTNSAQPQYKSHTWCF